MERFMHHHKSTVRGIGESLPKKMISGASFTIPHNTMKKIRPGVYAKRLQSLELRQETGGWIPG